MYSLANIRTVHLEVTSKCNASCPMCARNISGGAVNPKLPITELFLSDIQTIFPHEVLEKLERIYFCGNYGDPGMARDTLEILEYMRAQNSKLDLEIYSNGSVRGPEWWSKIAQTGTRARFSVDGLGDTNPIYRRGTKWDTILKNMRAYLEAGGSAEWDFIVFRHNEHQVEEARALAKELGFRKFNVKKTGRFFNATKGQVDSGQEVLNAKGEVEYHIHQPSNPTYLNPALKKEAEIIAKFGSFNEFFGQTDIECKVAKEASLFVTAEGHVMPCCWTAIELYNWHTPKRSAPLWKMIDDLPEGLESLNAKRRPLAEILNGPFFQKKIPGSWDIKGFENGRLFVCGNICGKGFDAFQAQFQEEKRPPARKWLRRLGL